MAKPIIKLHHLRLTLNQIELFNHLSFQLHSQQILAILGPNGAGKTSLLRTILGHLAPTSGKLTISTKLSLVPQHLPSQLNYSVLEVTSWGKAAELPWYATPSNADMNDCLKALDLLNLKSLASTPFYQLSGGQQKLVFIAQALASQAQLLLLDEPFSSLDYYNQLHLLALLKRLVKAQNISLIFTTHDPNHALELADQTLLMSGNSPHSTFGQTDKVITKPNLQKLYGIHVEILKTNKAQPPVIIPTLPYNSKE